MRAGQLAGPSAAAPGAPWNAHEWLPTLVHTSALLGKLPRELGNQDRVDWVPMDVAAGAVLDVAVSLTAAPSSDQDSAHVFHLTNPHTTTWSALYPQIQTHFAATGKQLEVVSYGAWVDALRSIPQTKENAERVPGLKLLEFYESLRPATGLGLPALRTARTERVSRTLREGGAVDGEVMRKWLQQWAF